MPGFFKKSKQTTDLLLIHIKEYVCLSSKINTDEKHFFLTLLCNRVSEFETELFKSNLSVSDRTQVLKQYSRFTNTVHQCMISTRPETISFLMNNYFNKQYHPVGVYEIQKPNLTAQRLLGATVGLGVGLLLASIALFSINLIISTILFAVAITLICPSALYWALPNMLDTTSKKNWEQLIFQEAAKLNNPDAIFNEGSILHKTVSEI